jgi:hypothetical protein
MGKIILRSWFTVILFFFTLALFAQANSDSAMSLNSRMRSHNKIYVVMAVCLTILTGLILYLVRIDRKVNKAEKGMS